MRISMTNSQAAWIQHYLAEYDEYEAEVPAWNIEQDEPFGKIVLTFHELNGGSRFGIFPDQEPPEPLENRLEGYSVRV